MNVTETGYFRPADSHKTVGISRSTLYRWQQAGRLSSRKIGGLVFFSVQDVKSIIDDEGGKSGGVEHLS